MAIQQVTMPVSLKTDQYTAMFVANGHQESIERHEKRMAIFQERVAEAESELDDLLNAGYQIAGQYESDTQNVVSVTFILHKKGAGDAVHPEV